MLREVLGGLAAGERGPDGGAGVALVAGHFEGGGAERQRHLAEAGILWAPVRKSTALRTSSALPAAVASGSFMSVISAAVLRPAPLATATRLSRQGARPLERRHEGAGAGLDVEDQRAEAGRELLADRIEAVISGMDSTVAVTSRMA